MNPNTGTRIKCHLSTHTQYSFYTEENGQNEPKDVRIETVDYCLHDCAIIQHLATTANKNIIHFQIG